MARPKAGDALVIAHNIDEISRAQDRLSDIKTAHRALMEAQDEEATAERALREAEARLHDARRCTIVAQRRYERIVVEENRTIARLQADNAALCAGTRREQVA